ncbi:MAG TPA: hypothetical protein VFJ94_14075 [Intrasporangium sp.]|uniref:hypothetical protein n=1 Tax=Intrasporangium sp. TaxID=1925024 RepID=UPI002D77F99B|nr:hypothetical protein [Intrasporangium sp.]HET7399640.1 hypothetical protein [Intrasporangium sp.]
MAKLEAQTNPLIVDREAGDPDASTTITYDKLDDEVLWLRPPGGGWTSPNPFVLTGQPTADRTGTFVVTLTPGQIHDVAIFQRDRVPIDDQVVQTRAEAFLKVFCLWKEPENRTLVTDENSETGGTWHGHHIHTNVATSLAVVGASRTPPLLDANGIPHLVGADGGPAFPAGFGIDHVVELRPLLPGNHYFFTALVTDTFGNWEVMARQFTTLRRQLTVEFPTLHVFNDGDSSSHGEAHFTFRVMHGSPQSPKVIQDFDRPTADIDDWGETDRPYSLGFAHVGAPTTVHVEEQEVWVASWGTEEDGFLESDEGAGNFGVRLPLPAGKNLESVSNAPLFLDCPPTTTGDDFHYGVDVRWSVGYVP